MISYFVGNLFFLFINEIKFFELYEFFFVFLRDVIGFEDVVFVILEDE